MNYRHEFHAGNFADVFKHCVLISIIKALQRKDNSFCYLETHAGAGCYDLFSPAAQKNKEFENGITKIFAKENPPPLIQDYLNLIKKFNAEGELRYYPGSPLLAQQLLRQQDRMVLAELHSEEIIALKKYLKNDKRIAIHHQNGYQLLKACLPPKERRGFILLDPPYEANEYELLPAQIAEGIKHFATGIFALWYPIKNRARIKQLQQEIKNKIPKTLLTIELSIFANDAELLSGTGMLIINPPWQLEIQLEQSLAWLWQHLHISKQSSWQLHFF